MGQLICKLAMPEQRELRAILAGEIQILNETSVDAISHFVALANERDQKQRHEIEMLARGLDSVTEQRDNAIRELESIENPTGGIR